MAARGSAPTECVKRYGPGPGTRKASGPGSVGARAAVVRLGKLHKRADALGDIAANVEVGVLQGRKYAGFVHARRHARLHGLANGPILPVHQIPELHHFGRIKALLRHLKGLEQEMTADARAHRAERLEEESSDVFSRHTQQEIRVKELALF